MQKSESIKAIGAALMTFHVKVEKIPKDAKNPFYNSTYASLPNILDAINIPLAESGLTYVQFPTGQNQLVTCLMHPESGEWMEAGYEMKPTKDDPQGRGSAITYQRRYALAAILGLSIDEDDDGNEASKKNKKDDLPWLNEGSKEYNGAIAKMKEGKSSIEALKEFFRISKKVEEKLKSESKIA